MTASRKALTSAVALAALGAWLVLKALDAPGAGVPERLGALVLLTTAGLIAFSPGILRDGLRDAAATAVKSDERLHLAALAVLVLLAAVVRIRFLGESMRFDEAAVFNDFVSKPPGFSLAQYPLPGNHLFHTLLEHVTWRALGDAPQVLRLPAFLAGVALVPALYAGGRTLYDRETGLVAAALAVPSGALIEYSVNARGYSLTMLFTVVLVTLGVFALRRRSVAAGVLCALVAALGLWTIPTMAYALAVVVGFLGLVLVLDVPRGSRLACAVVLENALLLIGGLAWFLYEPVLGQRGFDYNEVKVPSGFARMIADAYATGYGPLKWLLAAGLVAAVVLHSRSSRLRAPLWLAVVIVVPLTVALSERVPPFVRSWLFLLPLLLVVSAAGIVGLLRLATARLDLRWRRPWVGVLVPVLLAAAFGAAVGFTDLPFAADRPVFDAERITRLLRDRTEVGDGVVVGRFASPTFNFYFRRAGFERLGSLSVKAAQAQFGGPPTVARSTLPVRSGRPIYLVETIRGPTRAQLRATVPLRRLKVLRRFESATVYVAYPSRLGRSAAKRKRP